LADFEALGQDRDDTDAPSPFALALAEWDKATLAHAAFCKQDKANRAAWLDANPCPFVMLNYPEARGAMDYARDARTIFNGPWLKISSDLVELARSDLPRLELHHVRTFWTSERYAQMFVDGERITKGGLGGPSDYVPQFMQDIEAHHVAFMEAFADASKEDDRLFSAKSDWELVTMLTPAATLADLALKNELHARSLLDGTYYGMARVVDGIAADTERLIGPALTSPALDAMRAPEYGDNGELLQGYETDLQQDRDGWAEWVNGRDAVQELKAMAAPTLKDTA
jgi:hypothetical protein